MRNGSLLILREFDGRLAQTRQKSGLRAGHKQTIRRMGTILNKKLIAGNRNHCLPARREFISSRILCEYIWCDLYSANEMHSRLLILANVFQDHCIRRQGLVPSQNNRLCEHLRIVDRQFVFQVSEIAPSKAFRNPERLCLRMAANVEPAQFVEARRLDHHRVPIPMSYGVTQPSWS